MHAYKHVMLDAMLLQKKTMQTVCMQNALELVGTMKRKDAPQKFPFQTAKNKFHRQKKRQLA